MCEAYVVVYIVIESQLPFITVTVFMKRLSTVRLPSSQCPSQVSHVRLFRSLDVVVVDCVLLCGCFYCCFPCLLVVVSFCCVVVGHEVLYLLLVSDCYVAVCCWFCCVVWLFVVFVLLCGC